MLKQIVAALTCAGLASAPLAQDTGKPVPRFPKAYKELQGQTKPPSNNWLLDANDDAERFRRLQVAIAGTEISMFEIGHRFESVHDAISRGNWRLATHHWDKIRDRMNTATMKRPGRTANLEEKYFDSGIWQALSDALKAADVSKSRTAFLSARQACMDCHRAENVAFQNDNLTFSRTSTFPRP
jgi:protease II